MRRLLASVTGLALLATAIGCHHYAGVCDCEFGYGCCYNYGGVPMGPVVVTPPTAPAAPVPAVPGPAAEPIKVMPKVEDKPASETPPTPGR
jgi:hypothetical protein